MLTKQKENYTLVLATENSFLEFFDSFLVSEKKLKNQNIIVQVSTTISANIADFLLFFDIAIKKKKNGTSFVIVNSCCNADDLPEELNIVPTLQEAKDIIEMETIERQLGF